MAKTRAKRMRATPEQIEKRMASVLHVVKRRRSWFSHSDVATKVADPNLSRTLALLVEVGELRKRGERRLRQYQVPG